MDYRVFPSHSSKDADYVQRVGRQVAPIGIDVYTAEHDLRPIAQSPSE